MNPRRTALAALVLLALAPCTTALAAPQPPQAVPIRIENGKLLGVLSPDQKVIAYKGIPYAQPPVDELRWQPPQPMGPWKKILFAGDFGPHCLQSGSSPDTIFHDPGASEDCLTLNVWAPADDKPSKKATALPVMVWINGTGYTTGGTSESRYDGQSLARRGVIVVSMNYRLGIFGFLALPDLTAESPHHTSGNYGLMDQAAAIAWIRRNIAAFGGDPANITVFGQSAGAFSVSALMASPLTKDLFAKAIGQSGAAFYNASLNFPAREQAEQADASWAARTFGSSKLFYLRQLPADELLKAATDRTSANPAPPFPPLVDGYFLPDTIPHIYADGRQAHIPLLAGWNANESRASSIPTAASFNAQVNASLGPGAAKFLAAFPASTDAEAARSANDYAGDRFVAFSTWSWLEAQSRTSNAPVYRYLFDLPSPGDRNHPASEVTFHSDDIEYVFNTLDSRPGVTLRPEDRAASDLMAQYWINFARTGDPNGPGLPHWPVYNAAGNYQVMHLDATPAAQPDALRPRYLYLDSLWGSTAPTQ